jgi:6-phosphogluconolactonase
MKRSVPFLLALVCCASLRAVPVFIGTDANPGNTAKGIYRADFDPETGKLSEAVLVAEVGAPGFLAKHPSMPILYSVGAPADGNQKPNTGSIHAFRIGSDFSLEKLAETSCGGKGPCHLAVSADGRSLAVANYGDGTVAMIRLDESGRLGVTTALLRHQGSGPNAQRQDGPHAHGVYFSPDGKQLLVPDLGIDKVVVYPFDAESSKLGSALPPIVTAPGAGPRHLAFSPDGSHAYVLNELNGTILVSAKDKAGWNPVQTVSTLPDGFSGANKSAEIELSRDGRFVYASNRGPDSIAVFQRDAADGRLTRLQLIPCGGKAPRHFTISSCGKWLLCGHHESDTIAVFRIDGESGKLDDAGATVPAPRPICILFP